MLKGFVSGEEKDIKRITMVGRNLVQLYQYSFKQTNHYYADYNTAIGSSGMSDLISAINVATDVDNVCLNFETDNDAFTPNLYVTYEGGINEDKRTTPFVINKGKKVSALIVRARSGSSAYDGTVVTVSKIMLNLGSTALPYEPYGYQEGWEVRDNVDRLIWGREDELQTATGTLPFKGYGLPLKTKSLLGNAVQNGTPAPDNIITPEMCGVRTGNLCLVSQSNSIYYAALNKYSVNDTSVTVTGEALFGFICKVSPNTDYTVSAHADTIGAQLRIREYSDVPPEWSTNFIKQPLNKQLTTYSDASFTTDSSTNCLLVVFYTPPTTTRINIFNIMLNSGSTALPYEPYGWKVPFTNAGQTLPVYLGEVPTVRRIKKLVFDGTEAWNTGSINLYLIIDGYGIGVPYSKALCTHAQNSSINNTGGAIFMKMSDFPPISTARDFKSYLTAQYAAGTPVTIWYVLKTPETTISNEPLCKISTYADELTTIQVHGLSAPLYGIGDYKDTLNLSTGVVTRKVKKLVLTGEENVENKSGNAKWYIPIADMKTPASTAAIEWCCSHYQAVANNVSWTSYDYMISWSSVDTGSSIGLRIRDVDFSTGKTVADFKSYLSAQYAAGTPVTVWYALAEPETETVTVPTGMTGEIEGYLTQVSTPTPTNRSVPKWNGAEETGGTYAVTVYTPPEILTTTGQNTLTVDTTLAPSSLTVKGHIKVLT